MSMKLYLCWKFLENRTRDMPQWGVYIPKFGNIFSFGGITPHPFSDEDQICRGRVDLCGQMLLLICIATFVLMPVTPTHWASAVLSLTGIIRSMSHLPFYSVILSRNIVTRQSCSIQLCMSRSATLSHKQELTNQRLQQFLATKLHRMEHCSIRKWSRATVTELRDTQYHILLCDKVAR